MFQESDYSARNSYYYVGKPLAQKAIDLLSSPVRDLFFNGRTYKVVKENNDDSKHSLEDKKNKPTWVKVALLVSIIGIPFVVGATILKIVIQKQEIKNINKSIEKMNAQNQSIQKELSSRQVREINNLKKDIDKTLKDIEQTKLNFEEACQKSYTDARIELFDKIFEYGKIRKSASKFLEQFPEVDFDPNSEDKKIFDDLYSQVYNLESAIDKKLVENIQDQQEKFQVRWILANGVPG
jgi:hypothetical protein